MSNINHIIKKTILCILVLFLFCVLRAHAAVLPPDTDNAALLYYQAFLLRPEIDDDTFLHFNSVLGGAQPNEKVREYLNMMETRESLRIAEAATKILDCSWGIILRSRNGSSLNTVVFQARQLAYLLEVDARTLAADGDHRAALERCLSIRRLAQHHADEGLVGYLASMPLHGRSFGCIQHVLSSMPAEANVLTWLQAQLSAVQGAPASPGRAMEITLDDDLEFYRMYPEALGEWRESVYERIEDDSARQEIMNLTDEALLERASELGHSFLSSINRIIGSDMTYRQRRAELQGLKAEWPDHGDNDPNTILSECVRINLDDVVKYHDIYVRRLANLNAVRAAIEIYLIEEETGQLPGTLPPYLPKDPFGDEKFGYEKTEEGFVLRCTEKEIGEDTLWDYEFRVVQ